MLQGPGYDAGVTAVEQLEGKVVMTGASGPSLRRAGGNSLTGLNRPTKRRTHRGAGAGEHFGLVGCTELFPGFFVVHFVLISGPLTQGAAPQLERRDFSGLSEYQFAGAGERIPRRRTSCHSTGSWTCGVSTFAPPKCSPGSRLPPDHRSPEQFSDQII